MNDNLKPCVCGCADIKELNPYGVSSVQCKNCHVSLRQEDWNRIMSRGSDEDLVRIAYCADGMFVASSEGNSGDEQAWRHHLKLARNDYYDKKYG